ncbi:adenosyl-hopene transferase HpnH [Rhodospirillum rubrum]|uniref:Radical SAM n=1 Tax=Rhodospirillum rubrum (strain ATCC 11170 / ATH 1.1.1 / DSM 467 / LMG 4362 / NCIMB 8255 / S1) TaxID=269796 RepID=Q2RYD0_RHORT|nr:adenosyl-hopene transferase HpnH [Rhodospirillum rubrum]ABC20865.1 Radical SAM [Rhodospirillum rubrum ATCC 11170]AEO46532.1 radical SAM family protein [Rhodospirillum rubrum F11]MBK5952422.1 hopanoid biosynthesis associated radical SAM protein HpnH [Rhodospirillum rubrum]QXG80566.1 adenosyl-hopene transferase HpnH [Rhodospirillum rubrum]HAQ00636.1 adenosyl-hopene transferase HpnH [Rhodospirillum rubrum]
MGVPLIQQIRIGAYLMRQRISGNQRYPLVLMLEPLFRCNLACAGCGKIDYPDSILNRRLSLEDCLGASDECGAPIVSIAGGEPLLHRDIVPIVEGLTARKRFVYLCTNALLLKKRMDDFKPSPYLTFSIHLDGDREHHDKAVSQEGVFDKAVEAIKLAREKGFRVTCNTTLFEGVPPERIAKFISYASNELGVEGVTVAAGFAYERAPLKDVFLGRQKTKQLFRDLFKLRDKSWRFNQSSLYLDFLAGNQTYHCTPWGNPTRNVFGWQRPCYLLNEGTVGSFRELMETTDWDSYGTGRYEKCANCMMHCGYEPTAVADTVAHPLKALAVALRGVRTEGPMAPEISFEGQRPAEYVFESVVKAELEKAPPATAKKAKAAAEAQSSAAE